MTLDNGIVAKGGFAVDCDHGGGRIAAGQNVKAADWEFMEAHPFRTKPSPYVNGLPSTFSKYCTIVK